MKFTIYSIVVLLLSVSAGLDALAVVNDRQEGGLSADLETVEHSLEVVGDFPEGATELGAGSVETQSDLAAESKVMTTMIPEATASLFGLLGLVLLFRRRRA